MATMMAIGASRRRARRWSGVVTTVRNSRARRPTSRSTLRLLITSRRSQPASAPRSPNMPHLSPHATSPTAWRRSPCSQTTPVMVHPHPHLPTEPLAPLVPSALESGTFAVALRPLRRLPRPSHHRGFDSRGARRRASNAKPPASSRDERCTTGDERCTTDNPTTKPHAQPCARHARLTRRTCLQLPEPLHRPLCNDPLLWGSTLNGISWHGMVIVARRRRALHLLMAVQDERKHKRCSIMECRRS